MSAAPSRPTFRTNALSAVGQSAKTSSLLLREPIAVRAHSSPRPPTPSAAAGQPRLTTVDLLHQYQHQQTALAQQQSATVLFSLGSAIHILTSHGVSPDFVLPLQRVFDEGMTQLAQMRPVTPATLAVSPRAPPAALTVPTCTALPPAAPAEQPGAAVAMDCDDDQEELAEVPRAQPATDAPAPAAVAVAVATQPAAEPAAAPAPAREALSASEDETVPATGAAPKTSRAAQRKRKVHALLGADGDADADAAAPKPKRSKAKPAAQPATEPATESATEPATKPAEEAAHAAPPVSQAPATAEAELPPPSQPPAAQRTQKPRPMPLERLLQLLPPYCADRMLVMLSVDRHDSDATSETRMRMPTDKETKELRLRVPPILRMALFLAMRAEFPDTPLDQLHTHLPTAAALEARSASPASRQHLQLAEELLQQGPPQALQQAHIELLLHSLPNWIFAPHLIAPADFERNSPALPHAPIWPAIFPVRTLQLLLSFEPTDDFPQAASPSLLRKMVPPILRATILAMTPDDIKRKCGSLDFIALRHELCGHDVRPSPVIALLAPDLVHQPLPPLVAHDPHDSDFHEADDDRAEQDRQHAIAAAAAAAKRMQLNAFDHPDLFDFAPRPRAPEVHAPAAPPAAVARKPRARVTIAASDDESTASAAPMQPHYHHTHDEDHACAQRLLGSADQDGAESERFSDLEDK